MEATVGGAAMTEGREPVSRRTLTAYAFLAQESRGQADLLRGLAPLFRPIAKKNAGRRFDTAAFSRSVSELYGFRIHPWALDDFAPRLAAAGLLVRVATSPTTHDYVFAEVTEDFADLSEKDVVELVERFLAFARPIAAERGLEATDQTLEAGLLGSLKDIDFLDILLRPERREGRAGRRVLSRTGEPDQSEVNEAKARMDVLCASFVLHCYRFDHPTYELLAQIVSGALITEAVLEFQAPSEPVRLDGMTVVLDAPFLMSLLDLSSPESHEFARDVVAQLTEHGARVATFRHCMEEIQDNLTAVITATRDGTGYGATSRRLTKTAFAAYASAIQNDPETRLRAAGIDLIEMLATERWYQNFTQQDEEDLESAFGLYENPVARSRDAASVAAVLRFRKGQRSRMASFHKTGIVFVTENPRVVRGAIRCLKTKQLYREGDVPPAITDRYLAGLLWALFGGRAVELAPKLLLANCSAALEPKSDLVSKMHRFLRELSRDQEEYFRALMTTERAAQHLVEITLGDSNYLTRENASHVLESLKATLTEANEAENAKRISALTEGHAQQIRMADVRRTELEEKIRRVDADRLIAASERNESSRQVEALKSEIERTQSEALEKERVRFERVAQRIKLRKERERLAVSLVVPSLGVLAGFLTDRLSGGLSVVGWAAIAVFAVLCFWWIPEYVLGRWLEKRAKAAFELECDDVGLDPKDSRFIIDLRSGEVGLVATTRSSSVTQAIGP